MRESDDVLAPEESDNHASIVASVNEALLEEHDRTGKPALRIYEPNTLSIVLGAGGRLETDVYVERAQLDRIPVLRRRGGGGTVLLAPGQLVFAVVAEVGSTYRNREHLCTINSWVTKALTQSGVTGVEPRGTCDLAIGSRKVLGASLFRRRSILFYQSSLLVCCDLSLFSRYLRYPIREPDYRAKRAHGSFCTTIADQGYSISPQEIGRALQLIVEENISSPGIGIPSCFQK